MKNLTALIAITGLTAVMSATAQASGTSEVSAETVRYSSPDPANVTDVVVLYRRIDAAASRVCGQRMSPGSPFVSRPWQHCVEGAMRHALASINAPSLTAYAAARGVPAYNSTVARGN
jgi:UrcA family protein